MLVTDMPITERPRETLLAAGPERLGAAELVAVLLGAGRRGENAIQLATNLLAARGGLQGLASTSTEEMLETPGMGPAKVARIAAAFDLCRRLRGSVADWGRRVRASADLVAPHMERLRHARVEHFLAILLDVRHHVMKDVVISTGTLTESLVHPREAFLPAIRASAASVAFVHNHPSGDPTPSRCDLETTRRLVGAGEILGIPVLDHVIIGRDEYVSLRESGAWPA